MMGRNSMEVNQGTMIEMVQHYLDNVLLKNPNQKVSSVNATCKTAGGASCFKIELESKTDENST